MTQHIKNEFFFMDTSAKYINYDERLARVTAYIYAHLDDELDMNRLAEVAYQSPYHFHRIYRAARGETIAATVRRLRLHRAASQLALSTLSVQDISRQAGYKNVQSFTRVFNARYGMPPARYRSHGNHTQFPSQPFDRSLAMYNVILKTIPDLEVVSIKHQGAYNQIGSAFERLGGWLGKRGLIDANSRMMAIGYDDPATVPEDQLRSRACITVSQVCTLEAPLERITIEGGRYAVLRYKGSYEALPAIYQWLFGTWLLQSGMELRDAPPFEEYLNTPLDTAPADLLTDIYLPLV